MEPPEEPQHPPSGPGFDAELFESLRPGAALKRLVLGYWSSMSDVVRDKPKPIHGTASFVQAKPVISARETVTPPETSPYRFDNPVAVLLVTFFLWIAAYLVSALIPQPPAILIFVLGILGALCALHFFDLVTPWFRHVSKLIRRIGWVFAVGVFCVVWGFFTWHRYTPDTFPVTFPRAWSEEVSTKRAEPVKFRVAYETVNQSGDSILVSSCSVSDIKPSSVDELAESSLIQAEFSIQKAAGACLNATHELPVGLGGNIYLAERWIPYLHYQGMLNGSEVLFYAGEINVRLADGRLKKFTVCGFNRGGSENYLCAQTGS